MKCSALVLLSILFFSGIVDASPRDLVASKELPRVAQSPSAEIPVLSTAVPTDTFVLGDWTFDAPGGGPDPQGWASYDVTTVSETYFHVDDFVGMDPPYAPLEGTKSMWCGLRENCNYGTPPGYGVSWRQYFETTSGFATAGDVTVSFITRYDSEPGYDYTYLEYYSKTGSWRTLASYNGQGQSSESHTIPEDSLDGTTQVRFRFISDGAFDDESGLFPTDGAIVIDSLLIVDGTGIVDYQDFESEGVGALSTSDGDWYAHPALGFGDFAGLFEGTTVVQEDSLVTNSTYLWGFFSGSTETVCVWRFSRPGSDSIHIEPGVRTMV